MNNIYTYIDNYGKYSFEEMDLNEVDAMIFSFLTYANYKKVITKNKVLTIQQAAEKHKEVYPKNNNDIIAVRESGKLLHDIKDTTRYKDCIMINYEYLGNNQIQFCAISFEYKKNHIFVAFEGTDDLFSGWKENFLLSCEFPTISHKKAIEYLNKHFTFNIKSLVIGGHSKGGNLALVASMYANPFVRLKIKKVYNGDGPGLLEKEFSSYRYKRLLKKYVHLMPDYSVVGILLNHSNDEVVHSYAKNILAHDIMNWETEEDTFKRTKLSYFSKELDTDFSEWFKKVSEEDKRSFVRNFEKILEKANITSITELKENHLRIVKLIQESKEIDDSVKKSIEEFIKILIKCIEKTQKEEWKNTVNTIFKWKKKDEAK